MRRPLHRSCTSLRVESKVQASAAVLWQGCHRGRLRFVMLTRGGRASSAPRQFKASSSDGLRAVVTSTGRRPVRHAFAPLGFKVGLAQLGSHTDVQDILQETRRGKRRIFGIQNINKKIEMRRMRREPKEIGQRSDRGWRYRKSRFCSMEWKLYSRAPLSRRAQSVDPTTNTENNRLSDSFQLTLGAQFGPSRKMPSVQLTASRLTTSPLPNTEPLAIQI